MTDTATLPGSRRPTSSPDVSRGVRPRVPGLSMQLTWPFLAMLRASGHDVAHVLGLFGLSYEQATRRHAVLPHQTAMAMLEWTISRLGTEDVGLLAASWEELSPISLLDCASLAASSFCEYVEVFNRYAYLVAGNVELRAHLEGDVLVHGCQAKPGLELAPAAIDYAVASIARRCRGSSRPEPRLRHVELQRPRPARPELYRALFGAPVVFGRSENLLVFEGLNARPRFAEPMLHAALLDQVERIAQEQLPVCTTSERVRQAIAELTPESVSLHAVGRRLAVSPSHLRHLLHAEGTSFREVWDHARCEMACELLRRTELGVDGVSSKVGFGHVNGFIRAFRRWTGTTPGEYRRTS